MVITTSAILDTSDRRQYAERQARLHAKEQRLESTSYRDLRGTKLLVIALFGG